LDLLPVTLLSKCLTHQYSHEKPRSPTKIGTLLLKCHQNEFFVIIKGIPAKKKNLSLPPRLMDKRIYLLKIIDTQMSSQMPTRTSKIVIVGLPKGTK